MYRTVRFKEQVKSSSDFSTWLETRSALGVDGVNDKTHSSFKKEKRAECHRVLQDKSHMRPRGVTLSIKA